MTGRVSAQLQNKPSVFAEHGPRGGHVDTVSFWFRVMAASTRSGDQLQCKNLQDYLKTLPLPVLDRLYNHPATCLAVFRYVETAVMILVTRLSKKIAIVWAIKEGYCSAFAVVMLFTR